MKLILKRRRHRPWREWENSEGPGYRDGRAAAAQRPSQLIIAGAQIHRVCLTQRCAVQVVGGEHTDVGLWKSVHVES